MGKVEELKARFGRHMDESMGLSAAVGPGGSQGTSAGGSGSVPGSQQGVTRFREASRIAIERIMADPDQPRTEFPEEELHRLAASLKARGQLQPIRVRWSLDHGKYVILTGERRWRAAGIAGLTALECVIENRDLTPAEILQDQIVENCLREDLKPIEQARAFQRLMGAKGWSVRQVAQELHVAHGTVVKALALLDLPDAVQELIEQGALKPATAYEIGKAGTHEDQVELATHVISEGLTRDQVTTAVKERKTGAVMPSAKRTKEEVQLDDGTRVTVTGPAVAGGIDAIAAALDLARERLLTSAGELAREQAA